MWPDIVEFCSTSSSVADEKKREEEERKKKESLVKLKSADNYVGRPNYVLRLKT